MMHHMAVLLQLTVTPSTQDQFNELDARVGQAMMDAGGPPPSLMSHCVYPEGDGFVVAEVWGMESEGQWFRGRRTASATDELGLTGNETSVRPVWSFARA